MSSFIRWIQDGLNDNLGLDQKDLIDALEKEFEIRIPDENSTITTVGEVCSLVEKLILGKQEQRVAEDIWPRVQRIFANDLDMDVNKISRSTSLKELGY